MNYCMINGHKAIPTMGSNIKVTVENPLIKDRDAQTMEIEFPLAIAVNREVFGATHRIDVAKHATTFASCALYAGNMLVIQGKGTVTTFTETSVKMQIVSGMRSTEYDQTWDDVFIDKIDAYDYINPLPGGLLPNQGEGWAVEFPPVYDETNDTVLNSRYYVLGYETAFNLNPAPQVYLRYALRKVLAYVGYTLPTCFMDEEPWRRLLIYNPHTAVNVRGSLPHWSVKTFLTEFKKLFNTSFVFNEADKTVSLQSLDDVSEAVEYECLDEFTTDYDEDGLEYTGASNLEYNLSDSEENKYADMPEDILAMFTVKEYETQAAANTAAKAMTEQERMTTLFRLTADPYGEGWAYCANKTDDDGNTTYSVQPCLWYLHMRRQPGDGVSTVQLNMVPCADQYVEFDIKRTAYIGNIVATKTYKVGFSMPSSTNDDEQSVGTYQEYVSVQDYFENGDEPSEQDEAERMELYFLKDTTYSFDTGFSSTPLTFKAAGSWYAKGSLRFEGGGGAANIGQFHQQAKTIENREQIVIKFLADTLPDPKRIFLFRNKRFLCDKIEMQITDTGIDRLMTGYFYEIT